LKSPQSAPRAVKSTPSLNKGRSCLTKPPHSKKDWKVQSSKASKTTFHQLSPRWQAMPLMEKEIEIFIQEVHKELKGGFRFQTWQTVTECLTKTQIWWTSSHYWGWSSKIRTNNCFRWPWASTRFSISFYKTSSQWQTRMRWWEFREWKRRLWDRKRISKNPRTWAAYTGSRSSETNFQTGSPNSTSRGPSLITGESREVTIRHLRVLLVKSLPEPKTTKARSRSRRR
jgi:hypothetical protein